MSVSTVSRAVAGLGQATSETFTRKQRLVLLEIAVIAYVATALVAGPIGFLSETGFGASLVLDASPVAAIVKTCLWTLLVGVAATFAGRSVRPDAGLFAACIALLAIRRVGGTARDVYLYHPTAGAMRGLALELLLLGLLLAAIHVISRVLVARRLIPDDVEHDSILPKPEQVGQKVIATLATALTLGLAVLIICRSDERMQVTIALAAGGLVASLCAVRFIPATPSSWYWVGAIGIGVAGYLLASLSPGMNLVIGEPGGYAPALARALPLDYASAGVAGVIYGYWIGRPMIPEDSRLLPPSEQPASAAPGA